MKTFLLTGLLLALAAAPSPRPIVEAATTMPAQAEARVETITGELDGGTGGVSVDAAGNVYVADFGRILSDAATMGRKIFRIAAAAEPGGGDPRGAEIPGGEVAGGGGAVTDVEVFATGFEGASGNAFDAAGFLYQSNIRGNYVSRISPDGSHEVFVRDGIVAPVGIAIDPDGVLFVANCGDNSVRRVTPDGGSHAFAASELMRCPNGITLDTDGNVYVANFYNGDVLKITPTGEVSRLATLPGNNNGHLTHYDGDLYVVARADHRVYRVSLSGAVVPFAGTGARGRRDGAASEAQFSLPNDIAIDADRGAFYVNEIAATEGDPNVLAPMVVRRIRLR